MTTEERILAYLDGSLDEHQSAELMHQLSVSPENRVILEQHIKLSELTRVAQRPFEVPTALEETMAKRLPAVISGQAATTSGLRSTSMVSSLLLALRGYPARFALGGLVALLAGGALYWYALTGSSPTPDPRTSSNTALETNTSTSEHSAISPQTLTSHSQPTVAQGQETDATASVANITASSSSALRSGAPIKSHALNNVRPNSAMSVPTSRDRSSNTSLSATTSARQPLVRNGNTDVANTNSTTASNATNSTTNAIGMSAQESSIVLVPRAAVRTESSADIASIIGGDTHRFSKLSDLQGHDDGHRSDWALRVSLGMGSTFLYVPSHSNGYASRGETSFNLGADYSLSPSWALGAELGSTANQTLSSSSTIVADQTISRIETHATSTTSTNLFVRGVVRYCVNPYDQFRIECSGGGGRVMGSGGGWMASAQVGFSTAIGALDGLDFQTFVLYSGVWSSSPAAINDVSSSASGPIEYSTTNVPSSKIYTPAITVRAGLQYRLP